MIYHIATCADWNVEGDYYESSRFAEDGFVHCSNAGQVVRIANGMFKEAKDIILLEIDPTKLISKTVYENLLGGTELFPHVYGKINRSAVTRLIEPWQSKDGAFEFPEEWT